MSKNKEIAQTILAQLGGHRFIAMTGSKNFIAIENGLSMKLTRNGSKANYLRIKLNSMDLYDMEFISARKANIKTIEEFNGVYSDMLATLFTDITGLYTYL